jgi:hypothetical protein
MALVRAARAMAACLQVPTLHLPSFVFPYYQLPAIDFIRDNWTLQILKLKF